MCRVRAETAFRSPGTGGWSVAGLAMARSQRIARRDVNFAEGRRAACRFGHRQTEQRVGETGRELAVLQARARAAHLNHLALRAHGKLDGDHPLGATAK